MNKADEIQWTQPFYMLFTTNPGVIRRVINRAAECEYVHQWHDYALRGQPHQQRWIGSAQWVEGTSPLGAVALEFAKHALSGYTFAELKDRLMRDLEFGAVDGPPAEELAPRPSGRSQADAAAVAAKRSKRPTRQKSQQARRKKHPAKEKALKVVHIAQPDLLS